jgi:hypothetical protein
MPWVKIDRRHRCAKPCWSTIRESGAEPGDIWECGDCTTRWELLDPITFVPSDGHSIPQWRKPSGSIPGG